MISPVFHDTVFQHAVVPEGSPGYTVLNHPDSISPPATTSHPVPAASRERLQDPVRLGVVLAELAACYGLSEEPSPPAGVVNLPLASFEFARAGFLPAMA